LWKWEESSSNKKINNRSLVIFRIRKSPDIIRKISEKLGTIRFQLI
jgi:hypothetical protein